jgi:AcrR family transcriptional regulator
MVTSPDRRVRRTRAALRDALLDLIAERGYEAVTVQDIIDRADVGRSTFYNHYTDKDDLLRDGFAGLRSILTAAPSAGGSSRQRLRFSLPLLRHVHEQRRLVAALLSHGGRTRVLNHVEDLLTAIVREELDTLGDATTVPSDATATYIVGAYIALMRWWLTDRPDLGPEDADRIFHALVGPGLRASIR